MKLKTLVSAIFLLAIFVLVGGSFVKTGLATAVPTVENTLALCTDGIDNDGNFLVDMSDPSCASFAVTLSPTPIPAENTLALCTDGIDNNGNFLVDASDPACAPFYATPTPSATPVPPENTLALCTDGIDNDGNFLVDASDPACAPFYVTPTPTPTPVASVPNTGGGAPFVIPTPTPTPTATLAATGGAATPTPTPTGQVLGAATEPQLPASCTPYITSYLKFGAKNNAGEVKKLQVFLNEKLGLKLLVSGFFGSKTFASVKTLQSTYSDAILKPWITQGIVAKLEPTGYVFKTTKWFINSQKCPELGVAVPNLK